ncbi:hypothetical protein FRC12_006201 [Ceratobasidium sp. 428]|nr:hypothetical protein FRC12_006201 [Ceratobasidium sp. 428]
MSAAQHQAARQRLQSVRMRLSDAIIDYNDACRFLEDTCSIAPLASLPRSFELEQTLLTIEKERLQLSLDESSTRKSRDILNDIHHRSRMTAPIYSLPSELLSRIFSEAACHCTASAGDFETVLPVLDPMVISAVCRQWRQHAINQQSLWTHLDLKASSRDYNYGYYSSSVWLERTQGAPIFVHIRKHLCFSKSYRYDGHSSSDNDEDTPAPPLQKLMEFLTPLMSQVCSLNLDFSWPQEYVFNALFKCWVSHFTTGLAKSLHIQSTEMFASLNINLPHSQLQLLDSFESLCLFNTYLPLDGVSLRHLVELEIKATIDSPWDMSPVSFAEVLASCPQLRILCIDGLTIGEEDWHEDEEETIEPVPLRELQVLNIGASTPVDSAERALKLLDPGPALMAVGLDFFNYTAFSGQASAGLDLFLSPGRAKTLHVYGGPSANSGTNPVMQFGALPAIETLVLHDCRLSAFAEIWQASKSSVKTHGNSRSLKSSKRMFWPRITSLHLHRCQLEMAEVLGFASSHPSRSISLWDCYDEPTQRLPIRPETWREYVRQLPDKVPGTVYIKNGCNDWPSLSKYPF